MSLTSSRLERVLLGFFDHMIMMKMFHFQTEKYASHKESDLYLAKFLLNLDQFMEVAQGITGTVETPRITMDIDMTSDATITKELSSFVRMVNEARFKRHPELWAIIDAMVADANQLKYLLTFD